MSYRLGQTSGQIADLVEADQVLAVLSGRGQQDEAFPHDSFTDCQVVLAIELPARPRCWQQGAAQIVGLCQPEVRGRISRCVKLQAAEQRPDLPHATESLS